MTTFMPTTMPMTGDFDSRGLRQVTTASVAHGSAADLPTPSERAVGAVERVVCENALSCACRALNFCDCAGVCGERPNRMVSVC